MEVERYKELVRRGLCAHAAAAAVISASYYQGHKNGLSYAECQDQAAKVFSEIQAIWRNE